MTEARRPNRVRVGHQWFPISWLTEQQWKQKGYDLELSGHSWWSGGQIAIRTTQDGEPYALHGLQETLLHEILHMCWEVACLGTRGAIDKDDVEEFTVRALAFPLVQVLHDNPKVLAYLTA